MTMLTAFLFAMLGALLASFAGVVAERLHTGTRWARGRSRCNSCSRTLAPLDLIPVLSWAASLGKCRTCRARVPFRYALTELAMAAVFALAYLKLGFSLGLALLLVSCVLLLIIVLYDIRHTIVPEGLAYALLALALLYAFLDSVDAYTLGVRLLVAGIIGLGFFLLYALSRGRAMGLGDSPVALALSVLTYPASIPGLLFSFWIGAAVGIGILVGKRKGSRMGIEVPFVPFLAAGFLLAYFSGWNPVPLF